MITYHIERLSNILSELKPLFNLHWEEIARHKDKYQLNIDYEKYLQLDNLNMLHTVIIRDEDKIVGYSISTVIHHLHYKDCLMSLNDVVFLSKDYRKGFTAIKFFKFIDKTLQERGVMRSHMSMKLAHDFGVLLERLGYEEIERVYEKVF